jgi:HAD superfamily hydrolase (TIGR01662 family)
VESRSDFVAAAKEFGIPVRFIHLNTSFEDSQFNACVRMVQSLGKILDPGERADSPNLFPVAVLYKYRKEFVAASTAEGFSSVEKVGFKRQNPATWKNKAIIVDYDGTLRETKSGAKFPVDPEDIKILPGRAKKLKEYQNQGYLLLGVSNQSGVAKGQLTRKQADACFERTNKLLGLDIEVSYCPHSVPPITCYCRKPGPGLGVEFILKHKLDPAQCIMVGDMTTDKTFAARCGFKFVDQEVFFKG